MARDPHKIRERNEELMKYLEELRKKHPEWRDEPLYEKVAARFFISSRTVSYVIQQEAKRVEEEMVSAFKNLVLEDPDREVMEILEEVAEKFSTSVKSLQYTLKYYDSQNGPDLFSQMEKS